MRENLRYTPAGIGGESCSLCQWLSGWRPRWFSRLTSCSCAFPRRTLRLVASPLLLDSSPPFALPAIHQRVSGEAGPGSAWRVRYQAPTRQSHWHSLAPAVLRTGGSLLLGRRH